MIPGAQIAETFHANHMLAARLLEGLSHIETLMEPEFKANSMNWIVGHLVNARCEALHFLDRPFDWQPEEGELYRTGSEPISPETAMRLDDLMARLTVAQAALEETLLASEEAFLADVVETRFGPRPRWQHLARLAWHETYHVGQMELLRTLALASRPE